MTKINKKILIIYILFFATSCHSTTEYFIKEKRDNGVIICNTNMCMPNYIEYHIDTYSSRVLFKVEPREIFIETNDNSSYEDGTSIEIETASLKPAGLYKYTTSKGNKKAIPYFKFKNNI